MDTIETIDKKIDYLKNLITDWNLESATKELYEAKIENLETEKAFLTELKG
jgi:hypothetical protein